MRSLILFGILCVLMVACDGESPTSSDGRITQLTGTISATSASTHIVTLNDSGNLRLTLDDVRPILLDVTTVDPSLLSFVLALGDFTSDGACNYTYSANFTKGSVASFGLGKGDYCVTLSDTALPEESSVAYTMTATVRD